jgi:hypothetical protein
MSQRFEYGLCRIKDIQVNAAADKEGRTTVTGVSVEGRAVRPSRRFWSSLHHRFGFTHNIFRYFRHDEVFQRISEVAANDAVRWCIAWGKKGRGKDREETGTLLAVSNPNTAVIKHNDLVGLLKRHDAESINYGSGTVRSVHTPRSSATFAIAGDSFQNKFVLETPIDGFGKPSVYLSLLRLICSNGAIGYTPAFRSELNVGRGGDGTNFALLRVLEGFNNEEGFAAMRQRFESAARSWASVHEVNTAYRTLARLLGTGGLAKEPGGDGASLPVPRAQVLRSFQKMTGDLSESYGLANLDALSVKRQRTLPAGCKVYELLNFASELATHHSTEDGQRSLQAFIGGLIGNEYDLEGTAEHFSDWRDFFVGHEATTGTLAALR